MHPSLSIEPLAPESFKPFGSVIDTRGEAGVAINEGNTIKFADLVPHDCGYDGGRVAVHLYRSRGRSLPLTITRLERHPLGTQAFWPLHETPFLIVVAAPSDVLDESGIRGFLTNGHQAVQYHRGTWHHYQISLENDCGYLVIDREGPGENCDEVGLARPLSVSSL